MVVKPYFGRIKVYNLSTNEFLGEYKSIPEEAALIILLQQDDVKVYADCYSRHITFEFDLDNGRTSIIPTGMKVPEKLFKLESFELENYCFKAARAALKLAGFREYLR